VVQAMRAADVVCVGETHDDPVAHQLEAFFAIEAAGEAYGRGVNQVVLSLEMFETDVQPVLDEYINGIIRSKDMMQDARPWGNYPKDYSPLVEMARESGLDLLAANAPRRYVAAAARGGKAALLELPESSRQFLCPIPCPEPSSEYLAHFNEEMLPAEHDQQLVAHDADEEVCDTEGCPYISFKANDEGMIDPVVLWDATMAHRIAERMKGVDAGDGFLMHVCGSFHCQRRLGIVEMLKHYAPELRVLVVTMYPEEDIKNFDQLEHGGKGDYVILTTQQSDLPPSRTQHHDEN